jgi:hypothetical protein
MFPKKAEKEGSTRGDLGRPSREGAIIGNPGPWDREEAARDLASPLSTWGCSVELLNWCS